MCQRLYKLLSTHLVRVHDFCPPSQLEHLLIKLGIRRNVATREQPLTLLVICSKDQSGKDCKGIPNVVYDLNPGVSILSVYSETCSAASSNRKYLRSPSINRNGIYLARSTNHSPGSEPNAFYELNTMSEIGADGGAASATSSASSSSIST